MKFHYIHSSIYITLCTLLLAGCMKEPPVMGVPKTYPYITIAQLKSFYQGSDLSLAPANTQGTSKVTGIVISDAANKNIPAGVMVVQSDTTGIALALDAATVATYSLGDSVEITFSEGSLVNYKGTLRVTGLKAESIKKVGAGKTVTAVLINLKTLNDNF